MKQHVRSRRQHSSARRLISWFGQTMDLGRSRNSRVMQYEVAVPALGRGADRSRSLVRLVSAFLLIASIWLVYWFISNDAFYVQSIQVTGNDRLAEAELLAMSGLQGVNIFWVDTRVVEQAFEALPDVASVRVTCSLPADCGVQLVERKPFLVWRQGNAEAWIGEDGGVLPARGDLRDATVLDATGSTALRPGDQVDPELVAAVAELKRLIPELRLYEYTENNGLSFQSSYGWKVQLGAGPEIESKLKVLDVLTKHLIDQGIAPALVDVRFPEAPYYRE